MMERYVQYKDSGVEWIGEIPHSWEVKRLKYCFSFKKGKLPSNQILSQLDGYLPYLSMEYLRGNSKQISYVRLEGNIHTENDDILLLWDGSNAGEFILSKEGILSSTMAKCIIKNDTSRQFSYYYFKGFEIELKKNTIGMGIPHVNGETLNNTLIAIPPKPEQTAIANYLDRKTAAIDQLIAQKERLLSLYEEEKTAIINQAVTQGINPDVKLKDSGVDWLGGIPEHWDISRAKFVSHIFVPQRNKPVLNQNNGLPWLTMEDMSSDRITRTNLKVSEEASKNAGSKVLKKGSVVASCVGNFGVCAINVVDVVINQQLQAFMPHN